MAQAQSSSVPLHPKSFYLSVSLGRSVVVDGILITCITFSVMLKNFTARLLRYAKGVNAL
ncbi:MAG: hypothetical protein E7368_00595 [Clostridiales bacterium]|nr:hypothetical protein [Clostridiales bacterium]